MPSLSKDNQADDALNNGKAFIWPPAHLVQPKHTPPPCAPNDELPLAEGAPNRALTRFTAHLHDVLRHVERLWLSPIARPLQERAAQTGWMPNGLSSYCNRCGSSLGAFEDRSPSTNDHHHNQSAHVSDPEFGCRACVGNKLPWLSLIRLGSFQADLRHWVHEVKFHRATVLGEQLGRALGRSLITWGAHEQVHDRSRLIVVPVPTTLGRRLTRGVGHAAAIARGVVHQLNAERNQSEMGGLPEKAKLLRALSRKEGADQRAVPASKRAANVRSVFRVTPAAEGIGDDDLVIVVDDVLTTGATARAVCSELRKAGVRRIVMAVVGVTPEPGRRELGGKIDAYDI